MTANTEISNATDERWMRRALELAVAAASEGEVPVGAIVVADGEIIGAGFNRPISTHDPSAHAEILALREAALARANYRVSNACLYVTLEPCVMCAGAMLHARIERLVFGAYDPNSGAAGSVVDVTDVPRFNHRLEVVGGVLDGECGEQLRQFFRARRK